MADIDAHVKRGHPILFGLLLLFALIEGCVTAYLVSKYNGQGYPNGSFRDRLRFAVFVSWWTVVFAALYIAFFLTGVGGAISSIASHGIWIFITWIFWLAVAGSITHMLGGGEICSHSTLTYCNQNVAAEAFAWIEWILITLLLVAVALLGSRAVRRGDTVSGPLA